MDTAPFHSELATAPDGGIVEWRQTQDGIKLRLGAWTAAAARGTILLFPGRTEYLEKYGRVIRDWTDAGLSVVSVDWRGQGLSDRLDENERVGHVHEFIDYQRDVAALVAFANEKGLPRPFMMVAHSMGGCIGLRALVDGLDVAKAVFSAPMWGIQMPSYAQPLTYVLPPMAKLLGREAMFAPGTTQQSYIIETAFEENMLTTDAETYRWLGTHAAASPSFSLGGPSVQWVGSALKEIKRLFAAPRPGVPSMTFVGSKEAIVSIDAIEQYCADWPVGDWHMVDGAKHEMMMERSEVRRHFMSEVLSFFGDAS